MAASSWSLALGGQRGEDAQVRHLRGLRRIGLVGALVAVGLATLLLATGPATVVACGPWARTVSVPQAPMRPLLEPGDVVGVTDVVPTGVTRGEVVAFVPPPAWRTDGFPPFVLRVVAIGGDSVELRDGHVDVDGIELVEPYVFRGDATLAQDGQPSSWVIPAGDIFVLGDRRAFAADSREFGPIPTSSIVGRVAYRCAPDDRRGPIG
jgi:signal peptidase I